MATSRLDSADFLEMLESAAVVIDEHRAALDRLELGSDWDTDPDAPRRRGVGSDLADLLSAAVAEAGGLAGGAAPSFAVICDALDRAAGNAGTAHTDLARLFGGIAEVLRNADAVDAERIAIALEVAGERLATSRVASSPGRLPVVVAVAADAALAALDDGATLGDVAIAAADEGLGELERGPVDDEFLSRRGSVDASAAGFLLMLDVFCAVVAGEPLPAPPPDVTEVAVREEGGLLYRVSCRVEPHDGCGLESADWLESTWHDLGSLVAFDGTVRPWRAEAVSTLPGALVEAIYEVGRPLELHIGVDSAP